MAVRKDQPLSEEDKSFLVRLAGKFEIGNPQGLPIVDIWTPASDIIGAKLLSPDRRCALALLTLSTEFLAVQNLDVLQAVNVTLDEARHSPDKPAGLELAVSGSAAIGGDVLTSAKESIEHTELMTVLMVLVILARGLSGPGAGHHSAGNAGDFGAGVDRRRGPTDPGGAVARHGVVRFQGLQNDEDLHRHDPVRGRH